MLAVLNWLTDLACFLAAIRAVAVPFVPATVATANLATQLILQIPITPGGVGVVEASPIGRPSGQTSYVITDNAAVVNFACPAFIGALVTTKPADMSGSPSYVQVVAPPPC